MQITDRHGDIVDEIPMTTAAPILALAWDKDGDNLAILQEGNGIVPLWSLSSRRITPLETNLRDPNFLAWSKTGPQLAIGTAKGNLLIYNKMKKQKIPIVGKHAKKISCGAWSNTGNKLALGSEDKVLTISNENGDTLLHTELKYNPLQTLFTCHRTGPKSTKEDDMVSSNLNGKSLHLLNIMDERDDPIELTFATNPSGGGCKYGDIVQHHWLEDNLLLIGFSGGYLVIVSTNPSEMGEEKHCQQFHTSNMASFSYNPHLKRVATAGDDGVRIIDITDFKECKSDYISPADLEDGRISIIAWSPDGQILTVGTNAGNVYNFLAKMSILNAKYKTSIAYLSSLRELSIVDAVKRSRPVDVPLSLEPSVIAVGSKHVAAGMNNKVYYHKITASNGSNVVNEQEYVGTVREVQLNQKFAVVLTDNKAMLHQIEGASGGPSSAAYNESTKTFPNREEGSYANITCVALTDDFLYYGTEAGTVEIFFLVDWTLLAGSELRIDNSVKRIYPNLNGTKLVIVDSTAQVYLYNPVTGGGVNQSLIKFENAPNTVVSAIWDVNNKNIVMLYDGKCIHTYVYVQSSMRGSFLSKLGPVEVSPEGEISMKPDRVEVTSGNLPLIASQGLITCQTMNGSLSTILHPYFSQLAEHANTSQRNSRDDKVSAKVLTERFCQNLAILQLEAAWQTALELDKKQFWLALSHKAMETLNVELASRIYRQLGDAAMVMALQDCMHIEDRHLLAGHISSLFGDYQRAQDLFLSSSRPMAALELRKDLLQWDQALKLAKALNFTTQIPDICVQYGQQLEFHDDANTALRMYEEAIDLQDSNQRPICPENLVQLAQKGISRCQIKLGNLRQGLRGANEINDKVLYQECGDLLEVQKQYTEAVTMYVKGEQYERAAYIYTKYLIKNDKSKINEAAQIMERVHNDQLHAIFAKACVAAGRYEEAVKAYEKAKDTDKIVEIKLKNLDQVQQAFDLVRATSSAQGALLVAEYCQEASDFRGAIEFLIIANKLEEGFNLAQSQSLVDLYATFLGDGISAEYALKVANHYEKAQEYGRAGKFYSMCGQYPRALKLFMQCGDREIDAAIEVVGKSQNDSLTHQLIDFLLGEKDGMPKDPNYIYRLYMALRKYEDAAKTALIIAKQEQDMGNYALARQVVVETIRQLEDSNIKVPSQIRSHFVLVHSYMLAKLLAKGGDHSGAARMLLRVAKNASKFPLHTVPIITSTVIECHRAGLLATSYEYAVILMRPEYRPSIDPNIKKKIEAIVRRKSSQTEAEPTEDVSACPITGEMIPITQLEASSRDSIPMCIISGRHMVLNDWCFCPNSKFPALYSEYSKYIQNEIDSFDYAAAGLAPGVAAYATDPLMNKKVSVNDLKVASEEEAKKYIQRYNNVLEEKPAEEKKEGAEEAGGDVKVSKTLSSRLRKAERNARRNNSEKADGKSSKKSAKNAEDSK